MILVVIETKIILVTIASKTTLVTIQAKMTLVTRLTLVTIVTTLTTHCRGYVKSYRITHNLKVLCGHWRYEPAYRR
jgi:hypothetical protein